jgi:serine/threonine-protein kinase RsbW
MVSVEETFEFRASLTELDEGLDLIHRSLDDLRRATGRPAGDQPLTLFEIALAEIGGNVLTHGRPAGSQRPIEYELHYRAGTVEALFTDGGPPAFEHLGREMPGHEHEDGRGLALSRAVLDVLGYQRDGELNRWRLVKRL